jgi:PPOX class probable F420-dependent enzyme
MVNGTFTADPPRRGDRRLRRVDGGRFTSLCELRPDSSVDLRGVLGTVTALRGALGAIRPIYGVSMSIQFPNHVRRLFEKANFAHLATIDATGKPQSVPVWVGIEGDHLLVCTGKTSQKAINAAHNPHVSLSITDYDDPYQAAWVRGTVIEIRNDDDLVDMDPISIKYTDEPFPFRQPGRVTIVIAPDSSDARNLPFDHTPAFT